MLTFPSYAEQQNEIIDLLREGKYTVDEETGKLPFEAMDKTDILDEMWFTGDGLTKKGKEVMAKIEEYKDEVKKILATL